MINNRIPSLNTAVCLLACLLLAACATEPARKPADVRPDSVARSHFEKGDYDTAAREFMRLAETASGNQALSYRLQAAGAWLEAGNLDNAAAILEQIDPPSEAATTQLRLQRRLLRARLALYRGEPEQARSYLPDAMPESADRALRADFHDIRARIFESGNHHTDAVRERNRLHSLLDTDQARRRNSARLWDNLVEMEADQRIALGREDTLRLGAWIELAQIRQHLLASPDQLTTAVDDWKRTYPDHPAAHEITSQLLATSRDLHFRPRSIALLLPFSGPYQRASEAIRDGFITAWYAAGDYRPAIRIYDTNSLDIADNYEKAVQDGAEFIVGPLEKNAIHTLLESTDINVTTLALNRIDSAEDPSGEESGNLYQFALAPEDEVRQIAHRGLLEGFGRALVIAPENQWGERMSSTFRQEWDELGGMTLESVGYNPGSRDFISPVQELLNIDSSEQRIRNLRQHLGRNITATSRKRRDAQFIYMGALPVAARQIVPQFRFFGINDIPVYSTSHVFSGVPDPQLDADMNGIEFTDIPWVLRPAGEYTPAQELIFDKWLSQNAAYSRLYAFGVDAFRIIPDLKKLSLLSGYRYAGETGELHIPDNNSIQRQLQWARFENGKPVRLDTGNHFAPRTESLPKR